MTRWIKKNVAKTRILYLVLFLALGALVADQVYGAGIAQLMEKKTLPEATIAVIDPETGSSSSSGGAFGVRVDVGDIILFKFAFTPAPDKEFRGIQSYLTEYIPPNTEVVGVRIMDANGHTIPPRYPGLSDYGCDTGCTTFADLPCTTGSPGCVGNQIDLSRGSIAQLHADTGIFYVGDAETRLARFPADQFITLTNGTLMDPEPVYIGPLKNLLDVGGVNVDIYAHNAWDWTQVKAYGISTAISTNSGKGETPYLYGSPVAGPETYYQYEATEVGGNVRFDNAVGPWNRIRYPGAKIGYGPADASGNDPATGVTYSRLIADPTTAMSGWDATPGSPISAEALRWALGDARIGVPQFVEVALRVNALPLDPNFGTGLGDHVNCGEVVGSHLSTKRTGSVGLGVENPWSTYLGSPSCVYLRLLHDITGSTDLAILSNVSFTLRTKNLSVNNETGVIIENRWDPTELDYLSTDSGPAPDGVPFTCADDSNKDCLRWTMGTLAPSDEINLETTYWAKNSPGTGIVTARYYSSELPSPGYYETRDVYVQEPVAVPEVILAPVVDETVTPAMPNGTYALTGSLTNSGNAIGSFLEINPRLPSGWSLVANQITIGAATVTCNVAAPNSVERPACPYTGTFVLGTTALSFSVNVPSAEPTDLYDLDLQIWLDSVETYFDHIVTIPVGLPRTVKPVLDCPIGSTAPEVTGTSVVDGDITLYFNLTRRGFANDGDDGADDGVWLIDDYDYFACPGLAQTPCESMEGCYWTGSACLGTNPFGGMYGGLEVSATAEVPGVSLPSEYSDRCEVEPKRECSDGLDNDSDGLIDFPDDPGCDSPTDSDESDDPECADGDDNDAANGTDWPEDLSCYGPDDPTEDGVPACSDGDDNDGDGDTDAADSDCIGPSGYDPNIVSEATLRECQDRINNDSGGVVDPILDGTVLTDFDIDPSRFLFSDSGCHTPFDDDESAVGFTPEDVYGRILVVFDTSGSMNWNTCTTDFTGGDGSVDFPGFDVDCDDLPAECAGTAAATELCDNGLADDSRMYQVKAGMTNVINSFGEVEFALMRFRQRGVGFEPPSTNAGLRSGGWQGGGLAPCGDFAGADVVVSFSPDNQQSLLTWMDGEHNYLGDDPPTTLDPPAGLDWELRGTGTTPLGGALTNALTYLAAVKSVDPIEDIENDCRPYRVVLVTDGLETCGGDPVFAAGELLAAGYPVDVIAFSTNDVCAPLDETDCGTTEGCSWDGSGSECLGLLDQIAAAGSDPARKAIAASDQAALSDAFAQIITETIKYEICNGVDDDCDGDIDEGFPGLGGVCNNGAPVDSPCYEEGTIVCSGDGDSTYCDLPGLTPVPGENEEVCDPPDTDDDCDGLIDEGLTCTCGGQEICNGLDDDCDGLIDEGSLPGVCVDCCGTDIGVCEFGDLLCVDPTPGTPGNGDSAIECVGGVIAGTEDVCDGLDNDCDAQVDEDVELCYPPASGCTGDPTSGYVCESFCRAGYIDCVDPTPGIPDNGDSAPGECLNYRGPETEECNAIDDNCDGDIDEDFTGSGAICGIDTGVCQTGTQICTGGVIVCDGEIGPSTDICDTFDNDCDGTPDQGFTDLGDACDNGELGICNEPGFRVCRADHLATICDAPAGTPATESCNGVDDDCDGVIDSIVEACYDETGCPGGSCIGECRTGTRTCPNNGWGACNDVGPIGEICNGLDDDCDGTPDDGNPGSGASCGSDVGLCESGTTNCQGGALACIDGVGPTTDICDTFDNDCDGTPDQGFTDLGDSCDNGMVGECAASGFKVCRADHLATECSAGPIAPVPEECNSLDDDCDGTIDGHVEECYTAAIGCVLGGTCVGECRTGSWTCTLSEWGTCNGEVIPTLEICNGLDDDCDGEIDEDFIGSGAVCGDSDVGLCQLGTQICTDGVIVCDGEIKPTTDICDTLDNDCDGTPDQGFTDLGDACDNGLLGECNNDGVMVCRADHLATECNAADGMPAAEECDGLDNDCDGVVDSYSEECFTGTSGCVIGDGCLGECQIGLRSCTDDVWSFCIGEVIPATETCNGLDDNCDGTPDDGNPDGGATCGSDEGECVAGTELCTGGAIICDGEVGPTSDVCNGLDDDCDGTPDQGFTDLGDDCNNGMIGACLIDGNMICRADGLTTECSAGPGTPTGETCNNVDDDCDGVVDSFLVQCYPYGSGCEIGVGCVGQCRIGVQECTAGEFDACAGDVGPATDICNGLDDDCDGEVDEDFPTLGDTCTKGTGFCTTTGVIACQLDGLGTYCTAADVIVGEEFCNGLDDDCDGEIDEDPLPAPIGDVCGATAPGCLPGVMECVDGIPQCIGGSGGTEEICNGVDDDCDTLIDEPILPGVGDPCTDPGFEAIGDTGECEFGGKICVDGALVCDGYIGPTEEICNGLDDDCDGEIDDFAICPDPENLCFESQCVILCELGEFPCPAGFMCVDIPDEDRYCVPNPCVGVTCENGFLPIPDGLAQTCTCTDPCDQMTCRPGEICNLGFCHDCFDPGYECGDGEICIVNESSVGECETDPCVTAGCDPDTQYCQDGACCPAVCDPACPAGTPCNLDNCEAVCEDDPCDGVNCPSGQLCDSETGECVGDRCTDVAPCSAGSICRPSDGQCIPDPCLVTNCPDGTACEITYDGAAICKAVAAPEEILAAGGGGCSVQPARSSGSSFSLLLLVGAALLLRRRRRQR